MANSEITTVTWVQELGDGDGGIWQDGMAFAEADSDRRREAVARISRITSSAASADHIDGVVTYARRVRGRRIEIVVEIPRETLDALHRRTVLTVHVTAARTAEPADVLAAVRQELDRAVARGVGVVALGPDSEQQLFELIQAVQAPGCLAAPFTSRRGE